MALLSRTHLVTFAIAAVGVAVFLSLGLPLPFLFGPMAACLVAALAGVDMKGPGEIGKASRTILGLAVGASITPEVVDRIPSMAISLALVPVYVFTIAAIGVPFFRRVAKFDPPTAYYCAMPGGFQDMIVFGEAAGANLRVLSLIQATRVLTIVTVAPFVLINFYGVEFVNPVGVPAMDLPWTELVLMIATAWIGWKGGERIGLFGATIIGPLVLAAILSMTGVLTDRPPREAVLTAQFFIGLSVGVHYVGVTLRELRNVVAVGAVFVLLLAVLAAVFTEVVVLSGLAPAVEGFLAFAPGGQAEMAIIAIVAGADLGYVVTHHLARMVLVIMLAPVMAKVAKAGPASDSQAPGC